MIKEVVFTPEGTASYPWLNTPDTAFGTPGSYKCGLVLDPSADPEVDKFLAKYESFKERAKADCIAEIQETLDTIPDNPKNKGARSTLLSLIEDIDNQFKEPLVDQYDDAGELTGRKILNCASKAEFKDKKTNTTICLKPDAFDATGKKMEEPPAIMGGAVLKLKIQFKNYFMNSNKTCGVAKPNIYAYQVKSLGGSCAGGFGDMDGGYVQEQKVEPTFDDDDLESAEYE